MYRVELKEFWQKVVEFFHRPFLMYRVELKDKLDINTLKRRKIALFLMYRVELKARRTKTHAGGEGNSVPNVPCGVERTERLSEKDKLVFVPNVPCGVKSSGMACACCC